jgi:hypothetical protein
VGEQGGNVGAEGDADAENDAREKHLALGEGD